MVDECKHEYVYSDLPVWGGGFNIVCRHCKQMEGFSKHKDEDYLKTLNAEYLDA
jgi:hypothetical protein